MKKNNLLFYVAVVLAIWFALTSWAWTYLICLFISYPFGLISFIMWLSLRKTNPERSQWILKILTIGLIVSMVMLVALLIAN
jgi:hypothetical protein